MAARRRGEDIIDFGMGNPDGPTPKHIVDKLVETVSRPDTHGYSVSKGGMQNLTRTLALEYAARGIRVNGIAPALMLRSTGQSEENYERVHADNPLGRGVEPKAALIAVLRKMLTILNATSGSVERELPIRHADQVFSPTWSPDGSKIEAVDGFVQLDCAKARSKNSRANSPTCTRG